MGCSQSKAASPSNVIDPVIQLGNTDKNTYLSAILEAPSDSDSLSLGLDHGIGSISLLTQIDYPAEAILGFSDSSQPPAVVAVVLDEILTKIVASSARLQNLSLPVIAASQEQSSSSSSTDVDAQASGGPPRSPPFVTPSSASACSGVTDASSDVTYSGYIKKMSSDKSKGWYFTVIVIDLPYSKVI